MIEADNGKVAVGMVPEWTSSADFQVATDILATDSSGKQHMIVSELDAKAPKSHASSATTYGVGTNANYGHCMTINNLTTSAHTNGYALSAYQGKLLNDKITTTNNSLINSVTISLGSYTIAAGSYYGGVDVTYTPPSGYTVIGFTLQLPSRYVGALRYTGGTFNGTLFNPTNGSGTYEVSVMITLLKT